MRFLSTLSLRRATAQVCQVVSAELYFYPRSPCGERLAPKQNPTEQRISIHALLAESDIKPIFGKIDTRNFYPRSPCGERQSTVLDTDERVSISIHALLAESDCVRGSCRFGTADFYPRSPCGERPREPATSGNDKKFLSTLSLRRATGSNQTIISQSNDFYPRSPCGERLRVLDGSKSSIEISIHALLAESDSAFEVLAVSALLISIHALLAESDIRYTVNFHAKTGFLSTLSLRRATREKPRQTRTDTNFYPRSPCGERLSSASDSLSDTSSSIHALLAESDVNGVGLIVHIGGFLSTLSLRRATDYEQYYIHAPGISIHALLAESDTQSPPSTTPTANFYPRSPCGERPASNQKARQAQHISIHALLAESDRL